MSTAKPSSPEVSARMSRQARRDTTPEVAVRKLLHAAGYRYRINERVPGMSRRTIDIAFTRAKVAVMIDGCFWHGCPEHATQPKANSEWWRVKLDRNMARDVETTEHLTAAGWTVLRFWEHEAPEEVAVLVRTAVQRRLADRTRGREAWED
ncbi:very short patch repair endonuclease [Streptomyces sp. NBC_01594]|uniref:very short patch repair endonuclease n=1 Tax=Streptomyces sp. NBC_01594 TaxID=2975890 RepID=UPI003867C185